MLTQDKITEIYCIADDFCKEFTREFKKLKTLSDTGSKHRNRSCEISDSEIIKILLLFETLFNNGVHLWYQGSETT